MQTYTVGYGDSVSKISKILYGDFSKTHEICKLNNLVDCDVVQPGQVLKVPDPTNIQDAEVVPLTVDAGQGWKKTVGKWFPWVVVAAAAYFLGKEASKQHKKNKAAKTSAVNGLAKLPRKQKKEVKTLLKKGKKIPAYYSYTNEWGNKVYKAKNGRYYVDVDGQLHKMTSEGEPEYPVRNFKKINGLSGVKKLSKQDAKRMAIDAGIDFNQDFHTLSSSKVDTLVELAKKSGYRKSKTSPGSRGRAFFEHLQKVKGLSGAKFGPRKTKKKFHGKKAITIGDWKVRYNPFYKKYQATHEGGNMEEFDTIDEAKTYIKRHG